MTVWSAHRAGKLCLPPGYGLEYGAGVLVVRRDDGSVVAAFSTRGVAPAEVTRTAEEGISVVRFPLTAIDHYSRRFFS